MSLLLKGEGVCVPFAKREGVKHDPFVKVQVSFVKGVSY